MNEPPPRPRTKRRPDPILAAVRDADPNESPSALADRLGVPLLKIYSARHRLKNKPRKRPSSTASFNVGKLRYRGVTRRIAGGGIVPINVRFDFDSPDGAKEATEWIAYYRRCGAPEELLSDLDSLFELIRRSDRGESTDG